MTPEVTSQLIQRSGAELTKIISLLIKTNLPVKILLQEERSRVHHPGNYRSTLPESFAELEDKVVSVDLAGYVHQYETPGAVLEHMQFITEVLVICKLIPGRVIRGDCLFHLGCDF